MKKLTLLTALLIVCSCSSRHSSSALSELGNEVPLAAQEYTDEIVMPNPLSIAMVAGKLLLFQGVGEDAILVVNPEDGTLQGRFGLRAWGRESLPIRYTGEAMSSETNFTSST